MKTLKNKLYAIALLVCGSLGVALENDATALVLFGMIAVPLFFAKENGFAERSGREQRLFLFALAAVTSPIMRPKYLLKRRN